MFQLNGATGVTLDHLSIIGAYIGVNAANGVNSTALIISNCDISDYYAGVMIGTTNSNDQFLNNNIHDNSNGNSGNVGLSISAEGAIVTGNFFTMTTSVSISRQVAE